MGSTKAYNRSWYQANKERIKARRRAYQLANPEKCREAAKKSSAKARLLHPERIKVSKRKSYLKRVDEERLGHYRRTYGVSKEDLAALRAKQDNKCAICKDALQVGRNTHLDHCHHTGKNRGLLCMHCNLAIHRIETVGKDWLKSAESYLAEYGTL